MSDAKLEDLKKEISLAVRTVTEIDSSFNQLGNTKEGKEKQAIEDHLETLRVSLKNTNGNILENLGEINVAKPLQNGSGKPEEPAKPSGWKKLLSLAPKKKKVKGGKKASKELSTLEKETIKRIKEKREKVASKKVEKPKQYSKLANKYFYGLSQKIVQEGRFETMKKDLVKTNLTFTPTTYFAIVLFSTFVSMVIAFVLFVFFLFFRVGFESPIISITLEGIGGRFLQFFWALIAIPTATFGFMYIYPSLEKKSLEKKIDQEIPFSTIHMSAISQSMLEPSKIFEIILSTGEYPNIGKEFTKLINKINVYGYDLVTSLRTTALNSPSQKLGELFNGLAMTITSGGDLREFFDKRSQTLLFEHKLEREKDTKAAETFMDVYISVVIAAPMILMLLLMLMKISGLGLALSTSSITLIMVLSVSLLNAAFLTFLYLKKS